MRIFVTGATGVVGRRAVPMLIAAGHEVTAVGRNPEKRRQLERAGAEPVDLDLFAPEDVRRAVAGHDAVVNLATHIPWGMRVFLAGVWRESGRLRRIASAILSEAARAGGASLHPGILCPDLSRSWRPLDRRDRAPAARALQPLGPRCRAFGGGGGTGIVPRFGAFYDPMPRMCAISSRWSTEALRPRRGRRGLHLVGLA